MFLPIPTIWKLLMMETIITIPVEFLGGYRLIIS